MTPRRPTDEILAREAAAFELVGTVHALLSTAERLPDGTLRIELSGGVLHHVLETYNRATHNEPLTVDDVGFARP